MPSPIPLLLSPKTGGAFPGVEAAASPFNVPEGNAVALDTSATTWTVNAPASPVTPAVFAVSDATGGAATRNITIQGNGKNIDGETSVLLDKANELGVFVYNGVQWNRVLPLYGFEGAAIEPQRLISSIADAIPPAAAQVNLRGTLAARPAAGAAGRLYFCTDSQAVWYDTGSAWTQVIQTLDQYGCAPLGASVPATNRAGSFTVGMQFTVGRSCLVTGIRFFWATAGAARTVRCTLWPNAGAALATVDVSVSASGIYEGYFTTPIAVNAATFYRASIWETSGGSYTAMTQSAVAAIIPRPSYWGGFVVPNAITQNAAGNAIPTATAGAEFYTVDPIVVPA